MQLLGPNDVNFSVELWFSSSIYKVSTKPEYPTLH